MRMGGMSKQKRGEGKQRFKEEGGKLGQGLGTLRRRGGWGVGAGTPLRTMAQ